MIGKIDHSFEAMRWSDPHEKEPDEDRLYVILLAQYVDIYDEEPKIMQAWYDTEEHRFYYYNEYETKMYIGRDVLAYTKWSTGDLFRPVTSHGKVEL